MGFLSGGGQDRLEVGGEVGAMDILLGTVGRFASCGSEKSDGGQRCGLVIPVGKVLVESARRLVQFLQPLFSAALRIMKCVTRRSLAQKKRALVGAFSQRHAGCHHVIRSQPKPRIFSPRTSFWLHRGGKIVPWVEDRSCYLRVHGFCRFHPLLRGQFHPCSWEAAGK